MNKKWMVVAMMLSAMIAVPAYAGTTEVDVNAGAQAGASADANGNKLNAHMSTGPSSAEIIMAPISTGPSSAEINMAPVSTGPATASNGTVSAATGPMQNSLTINGGEPSKIPLGTPVPVVPGVTAPQIFGDLQQRPANAKGIGVIVDFLRTCQPVATQEHPLADEFFTGHSGKTHGVFSPAKGDVGVSSYVDSASSSPAFSAGDFSNQSPTRQTASKSGAGAAVETVDAVFPTKPGKYECLAAMTIWADPGSQVPSTTPVADARIHALERIKGHKHVHLISFLEAVAAAEAMNTAGSAGGISPSAGVAPANLLSLFTLGAGFNTNKANAGAGADIGFTFYAVADSEDGNGVVIDPARISNMYNPPKEENADGKKLEALQKALRDVERK